MSTQKIRNIIHNKIDLIVSQAKIEIKNLGDKKLEELKNKIPTPKDIERKLLAEINQHTCSEKGKNRFTSISDNILKQLERIERILIRGKNKIDNLQTKLQGLVTDTGTITKIKSTLEGLTDILKVLNKIIIVSPISLAALTPVTGITGIGVKTLSDAIDIAKAKISEYSNLIISISANLPKYISKVINILSLITLAKSRLDLLLAAISRLKLFLLYLNQKHIENCELSLGGTVLNNNGTTPNQGIGTLNSNNILSAEEQQIIELIEGQYNDILTGLQAQGNSKAIETLFTLTEKYAPNYNISHKVIKI